MRRTLSSGTRSGAYVELQTAGQGIGTRLVRRALELARQKGAALATICVDTDNPGARRLYERQGFAEVGIGAFTTSGTLVDKDGQQRPWQNGPQVLVAQRLAARADGATPA